MRKYYEPQHPKIDSSHLSLNIKQHTKTKQTFLKDFFTIYKTETDTITDTVTDTVTPMMTPIVQKEDRIYVYTDGACIHNGKKNARAGIGIYFGEDDQRNISRQIDGKQTNNTAELTAIIDVFKILHEEIKQAKKICIFTDSQYSIKCIKTYGERNSKSGWKNDIPNKKLVQEIYTLFYKHKNIEVRHIKAHTGKTDIHSKGNEQADKLANKSIHIGDAKNIIPKLFLNIPFNKKEDIKKMGGKWDKHKKKWYIYENNPLKSSILLL